MTQTRTHGPTLKDADDDRLLSLSLSLSLSNPVCCGHVANGRKRERTSKTKWRERHSATNWSHCRQRIWRQTGIALKNKKILTGLGYNGHARMVRDAKEAKRTRSAIGYTCLRMDPPTGRVREYNGTDYGGARAFRLNETNWSTTAQGFLRCVFRKQRTFSII